MTLLQKCTCLMLLTRERHGEVQLHFDWRSDLEVFIETMARFHHLVPTAELVMLLDGALETHVETRKTSENTDYSLICWKFSEPDWAKRVYDLFYQLNSEV